jgi:hypothetical protein
VQDSEYGLKEVQIDKNCNFCCWVGLEMAKLMKRIPLSLSLGLAWLLQHGTAQSQFVLNPVPVLPAAEAGSVAWGDFDNDGRLDFVLSGSLASSLWRNTGSGFSNVTAALAPRLPGLYDSKIAWGDFDNDGRLDLLVTGLTNLSGGSVSQLWRNTGSKFTNVPVPGLPQVSESSIAWIDYDKDGRLDFFIAGTSNGTSSGAISQLWRNTGAGFTNVPIPGLVGTYFGSCTWADYDNDGRPDLLITGIADSSTGAAISQLWRNTTNGFTNIPIPGLRGIFAGSLAFGDYDNDGRADFLLEGLAGNTYVTELWRNTANGFTNVPVSGLPRFADGSLAWGDFDGDGRLDFLSTGLTNGVTEVSQLWRNTRTGFTNVPVPGLPGTFNNALAWGDYDSDGRLDFLIEGNIVSQIWRNTATSSNSPPDAPAGLSSMVTPEGVLFSWLASSNHQSGITYNLRIGTTPLGVDIVSPEADPNTGRRRVAIFGNIGTQLSAVMRLPPGNYYWSVQAVSSSFSGSPFAPEQELRLEPVIENISHNQGSFELSLAFVPSSALTVLASPDISVPLTNWINLGPMVEHSPGDFHFTDAQGTNMPQRFYRVRSR